MARRTSIRRGTQAVVFDMDMAEIAGLKDVFSALPDAMRRQIAKPIVDKLVQMGARTAKINVARMLPKRNPATRRWDRPTGALRDSIGNKTVALGKMKNKNMVFGLFGARMDFKVSKQTARNVSRNRELRRAVVVSEANPSGRVMTRHMPIPIGRIRKANGRTNQSSGSIQPYKYIHLVEHGHRGTAHLHIPPAQPYPFMRASNIAIRAIMPMVIRDMYSAKHKQVFAAAMRRASNPNRRSFVRRARV